MHTTVQLLQALKLEDKSRRKEFAVTILDRLDSDSGFLKRVCDGDELTFDVSGLLNRHNLRIWGRENPHDTCELERDFPSCGVESCMIKLSVCFSSLKNPLQLNFTSTF